MTISFNQSMIITVMSMSPGLRNVLDILAELARNDMETDILESNIISQGTIMIIGGSKTDTIRYIRYYHKLLEKERMQVS